MKKTKKGVIKTRKVLPKHSSTKVHGDNTKFDRVKEKCSHWDLDYLTREELEEINKSG